MRLMGPRAALIMPAIAMLDMADARHEVEEQGRRIQTSSATEPEPVNESRQVRRQRERAQRKGRAQ